MYVCSNSAAKETIGKKFLCTFLDNLVNCLVIRERYACMKFCKHFTVIEISSEWKHLQSCTATHLKANSSLILGKTKSFSVKLGEP
jgi:hypothetical protein